MYGAIRSHRRFVFAIRSSQPAFVSVFALLIDSNSTEILVDVVDVVLNGSGIDEKFLGVTLFALVPNTTEFMNAMSFAMNGNIALRYVLTVFSLSKKFRGEWELIGRVVWKSVQRTPFRCAFSRSPRWSPFRHGMIPLRWAKPPILSRVLSFLYSEQPHLS